MTTRQFGRDLLRGVLITVRAFVVIAGIVLSVWIAALLIFAFFIAPEGD
jgi:hypothetical protein